MIHRQSRYTVAATLNWIALVPFVIGGIGLVFLTEVNRALCGGMILSPLILQLTALALHRRRTDNPER